MDINGVKEYGKLMDKMQVAYTNLVATMEWELFRRGAYSGFLDDIYMRKVSAILDRQSPLPTHVLAEKAQSRLYSRERSSVLKAERFPISGR